MTQNTEGNRMVRYIRYILLGLVLVLVALASMLTAMRFAIHGREVAVPRLAGLIPSAAETTANDDGLILVIDDKYYSDAVPEGRILSQQPAAGVVVRRGLRVHVAVSLGPRHVDVPSVVGESRRAAEINLHRRGLELSSVAVMDDPGTLPGQVLAQNPPAYSANVTSPRVNLLLSSEGPQQSFIMPSFIGWHYADASQLITDAGFTLGKVNVSQALAPMGSNATPAGIILKQVPAAGSRIPAGTVISFDITR